MPDVTSHPIVRDEATGVAVGCPRGWQPVDGARAPIVLTLPRTSLPPSVFRPTITVNVEAAPPEPDSLATHSTTAIAGLLRAVPGLHVVSLDLVTFPGNHEGRRLVAVYHQPPHAVQLTQWWTIVNGVVSTVGVSSGIQQVDGLATDVDQCMDSFTPATRLPGAPARPPVAGQALLDEYALTSGVRLERLDWLSLAQPYRRHGPRLARDGWGLLVTALGQRVNPRQLSQQLRRQAEVLIRFGLLNPEGRLTDPGRSIADTLHRPMATFRADASYAGRTHSLRIAVGEGGAVALATASPVATVERSGDLERRTVLGPTPGPDTFDDPNDPADARLGDLALDIIEP